MPAATLQTYLRRHDSEEGNVIVDWCRVYGSKDSPGNGAGSTGPRLSRSDLFDAKLQTSSHFPGATTESSASPSERMRQKVASRRVGEHALFPQTLYHGPSPANEDGLKTGLLNPVSPADIPRVNQLIQSCGWPGSDLLECNAAPWRIPSWTIDTLLALLNNPEVPGKRIPVQRNDDGTYSGTYIGSYTGLYFGTACSISQVVGTRALHKGGVPFLLREALPQH